MSDDRDTTQRGGARHDGGASGQSTRRPTLKFSGRRGTPVDLRTHNVEGLPPEIRRTLTRVAQDRLGSNAAPARSPVLPAQATPLVDVGGTARSASTAAQAQRAAALPASTGHTAGTRPASTSSDGPLVVSQLAGVPVSAAPVPRERRSRRVRSTDAAPKSTVGLVPGPAADAVPFIAPLDVPPLADDAAVALIDATGDAQPVRDVGDDAAMSTPIAVPHELEAPAASEPVVAPATPDSIDEHSRQDLHSGDPMHDDQPAAEQTTSVSAEEVERPRKPMTRSERERRMKARAKLQKERAKARAKAEKSRRKSGATPTVDAPLAPTARVPETPIEIPVEVPVAIEAPVPAAIADIVPELPASASVALDAPAPVVVEPTSDALPTFPDLTAPVTTEAPPVEAAATTEAVAESPAEPVRRGGLRGLLGGGKAGKGEKAAQQPTPTAESKARAKARAKAKAAAAKRDVAAKPRRGAETPAADVASAPLPAATPDVAQPLVLGGIDAVPTPDEVPAAFDVTALLPLTEPQADATRAADVTADQVDATIASSLPSLPEPLVDVTLMPPPAPIGAATPLETSPTRPAPSDAPTFPTSDVAAPAMVPTGAVTWPGDSQVQQDATNVDAVEVVEVVDAVEVVVQAEAAPVADATAPLPSVSDWLLAPTMLEPVAELAPTQKPALTPEPEPAPADHVDEAPAPWSAAPVSLTGALPFDDDLPAPSPVTSSTELPEPHVEPEPVRAELVLPIEAVAAPTAVEPEPEVEPVAVAVPVLDELGTTVPVTEVAVEEAAPVTTPPVVEMPPVSEAPAVEISVARVEPVVATELEVPDFVPRARPASRSSSRSRTQTQRLGSDELREREQAIRERIASKQQEMQDLFARFSGE